MLSTLVNRIGDLILIIEALRATIAGVNNRRPTVHDIAKDLFIKYRDLSIETTPMGAKEKALLSYRGAQTLFDQGTEWERERKKKE